MSEEKPADVQPGMILMVLRDSPMQTLTTCVMWPGHLPEFPEQSVILINNSDFNWFATQALEHNLKLSRIKEDDRGNILYTLEEGQIIVPTRPAS